MAVGDLASFLKAARQVGIGAQVGPMGITPTPVTERVVFSIHGGRSEWGVLSDNGANGTFCPNAVKELFDC